MKSIFKGKKTEYPKLMISISSGNVFLMTGYEEGTVVSIGENNTNNLKLGDHDRNWNARSLRDVPSGEEVTLVN